MVRGLSLGVFQGFFVYAPEVSSLQLNIFHPYYVVHCVFETLFYHRYTTSETGPLSSLGRLTLPLIPFLHQILPPSFGLILEPGHK